MTKKRNSQPKNQLHLGEMLLEESPAAVRVGPEATRGVACVDRDRHLPQIRPPDRGGRSCPARLTTAGGA